MIKYENRFIQLWVLSAPPSSSGRSILSCTFENWFDLSLSLQLHVHRRRTQAAIGNMISIFPMLLFRFGPGAASETCIVTFRTTEFTTCNFLAIERCYKVFCNPAEQKQRATGFDHFFRHLEMLWSLHCWLIPDTQVLLNQFCPRTLCHF